MSEAPSFLLRIDPWATEYASALQIEDEEVDASPVEVDPTVEMDEWEPISPPPVTAPASVVFVDGVQQIETRVIAEKDGHLVYGAFASVAVGAVRCAGGSTSMEPADVRRILALTHDLGTGTIAVPCGPGAPLSFEPNVSGKEGYVGVADAIAETRREAELAYGKRMADQGNPLVVLDGRIPHAGDFPAHKSPVVGYAKTIHRRYVDPPYSNVLPLLAASQRSPLFLIKERFPLYSWYVRLSPVRRIDHALAGLVRLETSADVGKEQAIELANLTALELPRFASTPERDPRAPQNLLPIGGLELALRHQLGDRTWLRRGIETYLYRMVT